MLKLPNLSLKAELTKSLCGFEFQLFLSGRSASGGGEGGGGGGEPSQFVTALSLGLNGVLFVPIAFGVLCMLMRQGLTMKII